MTLANFICLKLGDCLDHRIVDVISIVIMRFAEEPPSVLATCPPSLHHSPLIKELSIALLRIVYSPSHLKSIPTL